MTDETIMNECTGIVSEPLHSSLNENDINFKMFSSLEVFRFCSETKFMLMSWKVENRTF